MSNLRMKKWIINYLIPLLIVTIVTIFSLYLLFNKGTYPGDDITFHSSQVYDLVYGFKKGSFFIKPNHITMGQFSYFAYGYYGPLSHYSAAIISYLFKINELVAIKIVMFIFIYSGNIFTFFIGNYITKNSYKALVGTIFYAFLPYLVFCALCRFAFAEVVAISLIPFVFYSLIRIVHDEDFKIYPYILLIISSTLLCLSHAFTTLVTATFAFIYLLVNIKIVLNRFKDKKRIIYLSLSLVSIFLLAFFYLIPALYYQNTHLYIVSNDNYEHTDINFVSNSTNTSYWYSGFFNIAYIQDQINKGYYSPKFGIASTYISFMIVLFSLLVALILDCFLLKKKKVNRYIRYGLILLITFIPSLAILFSYLSIFALITFYISYIYIDFSKEKYIKFKFKNIDLKPFLFPLISILILFLLVFTKNIWQIMPSMYRKCQFAWRLFGLLYFFIALLFFEILKIIPFKKSYLQIGLILCSSLIIFSQPLLEKQILQDNNPTYKYNAWNETSIKNVTHSGWLNEFVPIIYCSDYKNYEPEYTNSLYYKVRKAIVNQNKNYFVYEKEDYYYATLIGEGKLTVTTLNSPSLAFDLEVTNEAIFQLPQFYYEGYIIHVKDETNNKNYDIKPLNIDSLLAFKINEGTYSCHLEFIGTSYYQSGHLLFIVGLFLSSGLAVSGYYFKNKIKEDDIIYLLKRNQY